MSCNGYHRPKMTPNDEAVCFSHSAKAIETGMNPIILFPDNGK